MPETANQPKVGMIWGRSTEVSIPGSASHT